MSEKQRKPRLREPEKQRDGPVPIFPRLPRYHYVESVDAYSIGL